MTNTISEQEKTAFKILSGFQALELTLKLYLGCAYGVIRRKVGSSVPFKNRYEDIQSFPLERLLQLFQKLNENEDLQGRLNKLKEHRNNFAHQSLLSRHPELAEYLPKKVHASFQNIQTILNELDDCSIVLIGEFERLLTVSDSLHR